MNLSPILLFVYNRLSHTKQTIEALKCNILAEDSCLYIFSDGFKSSNDMPAVDNIRNYLKTIDGFKQIEIIERAENYGLAKSVISGINQVLEKHDSIIVLEDDLITSKHFLQFMNNGLQEFKHTDEVISIHGYCYPTKKNLPETFFLKGADCWGWATWKRGWDLFEADGAKLLAEIKKQKLIREFNFNNSYDYYKMLQKQVDGQNSSWAIRWYASAFLANKLTLYPGKSLVHNIGNDNSGTHSKKLSVFDTTINENLPLTKGLTIQENIAAKNIIGSYLKINKTKLSLLGFWGVISKKFKL